MDILVGDIGGTKTILAIFSSEAGPHEPLAEKTYLSAQFGSLEEIVKDFLSDLDYKVEKACFGVAGPVVNNKVRITNLPWLIDGSNLQKTFSFTSVKLLNDLEAMANAVVILEPEDTFVLNKGKAVEGGNIAILAAGTGLGEGFLTCKDGKYYAHASEGSHVSFGPVGDLQIGLLKYMNEQGFDHVSFERVCSGGMGIPFLYAYLKDTQYAPEPDWLTASLREADDPSPVIFSAAQDKDNPCKLAQAALDMFVAILGAEAGNLALKVLATGGVYIGGGIATHIVEELQHPVFLERLCAKGRFKELLSNIPVFVILNPKAGLLGAAAHGLSLD